MSSRAEIVICGAGIAGASAAYYLAVKHGVQDILLVDERPPLSLTSDKSTECYRNWWPGPGDAMVAFMNRSIDLMEDLADKNGNSIHLNRRGYLYLTADPTRIEAFSDAASEPATLGAGALRIHDGSSGKSPYQPAPAEGYQDQPTGADLILEPALIHKHFPYLSEQVKAALHVRRAGWFSAQQLGMFFLERARANGVRLIQRRVTSVDVTQGQIHCVGLDNGESVATRSFVNAAGPFLNDVGELIGLELPVYNELHLKLAFRDVRRAIDRSAPLLIWTDPQTLHWSSDEQELIKEDGMQWLLDEMPAGAHTRPEGGPDSDIVLMLWEYRLQETAPVWPPPLDEQYPELVLRGLTTMIPGLSTYLQKAPRPILDGGYYTKTRENRPLIGALPVPGAYVIGALSGYGVMASCAAGELLADIIVDAPLPSYARALSLERYQDPAYLQLLSNWGDSGQL